MKNERHEMLLKIVADTAIETQEQLLDELQRRGIKSTQATISRDIKQLHLVKEHVGDGTYRYAASKQRVRPNFADRLQTIFHQSVMGAEAAQNLVVIRTMAGMANAAAAALDSMEYDEIVGTIAGDDTIFVVLRDSESATDFSTEVRRLMR